MVYQWIEKGVTFATWRLGRLTQLLLLGVTMLIYCIILMNTANSLFLTHVGAEYLPLCFIGLGIFSALAYAWLSQIVDRYSRTQLFRYALILSIILAISLRFLLTIDWTPIYFINSINAFFQFDLYLGILFPNLLRDYFTTLEYKRNAPFIGVGQAIGILLGGGLTLWLSQYLQTEDLLLCLTFFYALGFGQVLYLEASQRRLDRFRHENRLSLIQTIKTFPDLVKRYPLVFYLASSSFLFIVVYVLSEFLWFSVYADHYQEEVLTGFLGLIRVISSSLQVLVLFCFTRPLLKWLGVARMNVVYPITTLSTLIGLAFQPNLGTAILLNMNGDSFGKSINAQIHQLNYNALPSEFSGRVRALSDGLFYALGISLAGGLLWISDRFLTLHQITWIGIGLGIVMLTLRMPMGRLYAEGLEMMIRSDSLNLDELNIQLPRQSSTVIREFLTEGDRYTQIKGLELATSLGRPSQFLEDVGPLLPKSDPEIRRALVRLFSSNPEGETIQHFESLLESNDPVQRALALEILIANQHSFQVEQLRALLADANPEIQILAAIAAAQTGATVKQPIREACERIWQMELPEDLARTVVRVIACSGNRDLTVLLQTVIDQGGPIVKQEGLQALASLTRPGDLDDAEIAVKDLEHQEPLVRAAAFNVLGVTRCKGMLRYVGIGLGDPDPRVRQQVISVLATYGQQGLALAQDSLSSTNPEVVRAAIAAIGQIKTKQASNILYDYLASDFQEVARTHRWQQQLPQDDPTWRPLAMAIADYHQRLIQNVLYILSCLGHSRTVDTVNRMLNTTDPRDFANAVEVLASLHHRRFVIPLLPVLEQWGQPEQEGNRRRSTRQWLRSKGYKLLLEALESTDRWIRIGALIALAMVPSALTKDPDPLVRAAAKQMFSPIIHHTSPENAFMNRLILLKNVALFKNLSLDELFLIDKMLEQEYVLAGQTIFSEGSWSSHFYIVAEGAVKIVKTIDGEERDLKHVTEGQHFGEVALFDDAPRWDGAIALKDSTLLKLEKSRFLSLSSQRPHILLEICRFLSQRLRETDKYRSLGKLLPPESDPGSDADLNAEAVGEEIQIASSS